MSNCTSCVNVLSFVSRLVAFFVRMLQELGSHFYLETEQTHCETRFIVGFCRQTAVGVPVCEAARQE